jgi:hypothetical protein
MRAGGMWSIWSARSSSWSNSGSALASGGGGPLSARTPHAAAAAVAGTPHGVRCCAAPGSSEPAGPVARHARFAAAAHPLCTAPAAHDDTRARTRMRILYLLTN